MNDYFKVKGNIQAYRVRDGYKELMYEHHNTIGTQLYSNLRDYLITRTGNLCVEAIAWGSYGYSCGSYKESDYAGTTPYGTQGGLIQSSIGSLQAKFSGTFSFTSTKQINSFQMGNGYTPANTGIIKLFTSPYCFDQSMITATTYLTYQNGDKLIIDWTITIGS